MLVGFIAPAETEVGSRFGVRITKVFVRRNRVAYLMIGTRHHAHADSSSGFAHSSISRIRASNG